MMDRPLLIASLLEHAATVFHDREIVSRTVEGGEHRYTWRDSAARTRQLAHALTDLGAVEADRIGTIAWNGFRHLELYFGVPGMGAITHTMNPRLHPDDFVYIVGDAEDRFLFVDTTFLPLVEGVIDRLPSVETVVVMTDRAHMPSTEIPGTLCYEELIEGQPDDYAWPDFDENTASSLCYTSGTTGHPKGVLYSHRSNVLHSYAASLPGGISFSEREACLPVVPMFHANAWGIPFASALSGVKLVFPGPYLDGKSLTELMNAEEVTLAAGVPTVWMGLLEHWRSTGERVPSLERVLVGGSAPPRSMIMEFQEDFGIGLVHAWGMTETSPLGTLSRLKPAMRDADIETRYDVLSKQGRPPYGIEIRIVDDDGEPLPRDGEAFGELEVRGPWVCSGYYGIEDSPAHRDDGWFATGDVAKIDPDGYVQITDRKKDLIKSGGEWISSIDLENLAAAHPDVAQAAVIGIPDEKWVERPLLIVVPKPDADLSKDRVLEFLSDKVAKWWLPDDVVFRETMPLGATGKVQKSKLRAEHAGRSQ